MARVFAVFMGITALMAVGCFGKAPNIVMILTDDQDVVMGGSTRDVMPHLHALVADHGLTLDNMFATTPVCCPSRSSFITGKALHSIPMTNNSIQGNCSSYAWQNGPEKENIGKLMQDAGYDTFYSGKYLNTYGYKAVGGLSHVPPGWNRWVTLQGNSRYYNWSASVDGVAVHHGDDYAEDYFTDFVANNTLQFVKQPRDKPFFAIAAPPSCHDPTEPAPQHADAFAGAKAPRLPNYGGGFSEDKHWFVRTYGKLGMPADRQAVTDWQFRRRWETLQSVDSFVERLIGTLDDMNVLDNTYVFYSSDHGYHFGLLGLLKDKRTPYEFDLRIPGFVRGPSIKGNTVTKAATTMLDFAPTFLDIAGAPIPPTMEGTSMLSKLKAPTDIPHRTFSVEYHGEANDMTRPPCQTLGGPGVASYIEGPEMTLEPPVFTGTTVCSPQDSQSQHYVCTRTLNATHNTLFCEFPDDAGAFMTDEGPAFFEYYDLNSDPWQRQNNFTSLAPEAAAALKAQLDAFKTCKGAGCVLEY